MARTISQIKKGMTDQFMNDPVIREKYGLKEGDTFDSVFSTVAMENILFGIFASAAYVLEVLFDTFRSAVDTKIAAAVPATVPWYHKICLEYQHGDKLIIDEATQQYVYEDLDESKRKVKFAAIRDKGAYVYILVSGEGSDGLPEALSNDVIVAFEQYLAARKPAGIQLEIKTYNPDDIKISMKVQYDTLIVNTDGTRINDSGRYPVEEAVESYLRSIEYGGVFNKTRLIDAVQKAEGVKDVVLQDVLVKPFSGEDYQSVVGNNYESVGGAFKAQDLRNSISYVDTL